MIKYKEADLAQVLIDYMSDKNWESYKEVSLKGKGGNIRSDIFFVNAYEKNSVEAKMSLSLKVIHQAKSWIPFSNKSYICIPKPKKKDSKIYKLGLEICRNLNIGIFIIDIKNKEVVEYYTPIINTIPKYPPLFEEQKNSIAGNDKSIFITSFKLTLLKIDFYMKDKTELTSLDEIFSNIQHHYKNKTSAINSYKKYIKKGIIKNYILVNNSIKSIYC